MAGRSDPRSLIDGIERLIQVDVGRNIGALFDASRGALWSAASALESAHPGRVGLITGFYVPQGSPPAAETDGPVGAALLAKGFEAIGIPCRVATDKLCRSADGSPRNMRGQDISSYTALLDDLFVAGPWQTIAIGDGGNEIGMGAIPRSLIARHVAHGETIACVTAARHLIVAGVSNWGAYALIGALAVLRDDWCRTLLGCLDETLDRAVLEAMIEQGPAVDGVSRLPTPTVDNIDIATHHHILRTIRTLVEQKHAL